MKKILHQKKIKSTKEKNEGKVDLNLAAWPYIFIPAWFWIYLLDVPYGYSTLPLISYHKESVGY